MDMHRQTSCPSPRLAAQVASLRRAPSPANRPVSGPSSANGADKWQLLRALTEGRVAFGLSDRSLLVLEALVSFHPVRQIDPRQRAIVFPSNAELILRARGMAPATLRRHLAALVAAGLIARRDSPNGKRYCRRGEGGTGDQSFGFDLTPLAARADEILAAAETAARDKRAVQRCRAEITVSLRQTARLIAAALDKGLDAKLWHAFKDRLVALSGRVSRTAPLDGLDGRRVQLAQLLAQAQAAWNEALSSLEMSTNDAQNEHHNQRAESEYSFEQPGKTGLDGTADGEQRQGSTSQDAGEILQNPARSHRPGLSLERLLRLCPDFAAYAAHGLSSWQDAARVAETVRNMLAIPASAWMRALRSLGRDGTTAVLCVILQRAETIRSPGAYLQALIAKAEKGLFSLETMLNSLLAQTATCR